MFVRRVSTQVIRGGSHCFHDTADVEAAHRISLKSHGTKIRVRTDTQTEKDLLSVTQEELVYDAVGNLLKGTSTTEATSTDASAASDATPDTSSNVVVLKLVATSRLVYGTIRDHLVHKEILLSWGEVVDMFLHCFPSVGEHLRNSETTWQIGQHCIHDSNGTRYHYWGTDTGYNHASRSGSRRRRDMVRVGLRGENLAEIVGFARVLLPPVTSSSGIPKARPEVVYLPDMLTWCVYLICLPGVPRS